MPWPTAIALPLAAGAVCRSHEMAVDHSCVRTRRTADRSHWTAVRSRETVVRKSWIVDHSRETVGHRNHEITIRIHKMTGHSWSGLVDRSWVCLAGRSWGGLADRSQWVCLADHSLVGLADRNCCG